LFISYFADTETKTDTKEGALLKTLFVIYLAQTWSITQFAVCSLHQMSKVTYFTVVWC